MKGQAPPRELMKIPLSFPTPTGEEGWRLAPLSDLSPGFRDGRCKSTLAWKKQVGKARAIQPPCTSRVVREGPAP
jgi:hypothetical protein